MDHAHPDMAPAVAADIMTTTVISVLPESSIRDVAKLLLQRRISAVPVLDGDGALLGIVSEGDLFGRSAQDRLAGQEWWLSLLSTPGQLQAAETEAAATRRVQDVMQSPVVTVAAETPLVEVAELLRAKSIKRVPVLRDGRVVGIVSRADLMRAVESLSAPPPTGMIGNMLAGLFNFGGADHHTTPQPAASAAAPLTAAAFQTLTDASAQRDLDDERASEHAADLQRIGQVRTMLREHLDTQMWDTLMTHARVAAAHGEKELELLRFPSALCSDEGREINNALPDWPATLRGEAAELYARWEKELKPAGFRLQARIATYPKGMPGDIALVLVWEA